LDTGVGTSVIVNADALELQSSEKSVSAHGATSSLQMNSLKVESFRLDGIVWKDFEGTLAL